MQVKNAPSFNFDQELLDVEELLALHLVRDREMSNEELDDPTTEVVVESPEEEDGANKIAPITEPPLTRANLWARSDAHPSILALLMFEHYEHTWLDWDVDLVEDTVRTLFGPPHPVNMGKILAAQTAYTKSAAWDEWHYFVFACQAFNDELVDPNFFRPPTVAEAGICVTILNLIDSKPAWSDEVKEFLRQVLVHEQFLFAPEPMEFVPAPEGVPPFDRVKVEKVRQNPRMMDESLEGFLGIRLREYDEAQRMMRERLRSQLRLVKRSS